MLKRCWLWLAGLLVAVGLGILGRDGRRARKAEAQVDELLQDATEANLAKAEKKAKQAETSKARAKDAARATKSVLAKVSDKDTDMAELLSVFERVRQPRG